MLLLHYFLCVLLRFDFGYCSAMALPAALVLDHLLAAAPRAPSWNLWQQYLRRVNNELAPPARLRPFPFPEWRAAVLRQHGALRGQDASSSAALDAFCNAAFSQIDWAFLHTAAARSAPGPPTGPRLFPGQPPVARVGRPHRPGLRAVRAAQRRLSRALQTLRSLPETAALNRITVDILRALQALQQAARPRLRRVASMAPASLSNLRPRQRQPAS